MIYTLSDLQAGRVAVVNDGTRDQLNAVLEAAFPNDCHAFGTSKYYLMDRRGYWRGDEETDLPLQPVCLFSLREEPRERVEDAEEQHKLWYSLLSMISDMWDNNNSAIEYCEENFIITRKNP